MSNKITDYWTVTAAARECGIKRPTLHYAIRTGHCKAKHLASGEPVVTIEAVEAYMAKDLRPGPKRKGE